MSSDVLDIYDHEVDKILAVLAALRDRASGRMLNYQAFEREIGERFAAIGFTVDVNWYEFEAGGQRQDGAMPEVTITGRTDQSFAFDPDRQVHEAVHDVLGLGEAGGVMTGRDTV